MNEATFTRRLTRAALSVDGNQWRLAELAAECKADKYEHWAERMGKHQLIGRAARTVRGWAQVAKFRQSVGAVVPAPYSFYAAAADFESKLPLAQIMEVMAVARSEDVTAEEFAAELRTQAGRPEPVPPTPAALRAALLAALRAWLAVAEPGVDAATEAGWRLAAVMEQGEIA